jgi:ABC-type multidrug transport system fused ATPase/permease subunit
MRLKIEPGSIVGIVGRSGCGKTTLHGLMTRLFSIDQGRILVGGTDVEEWPLDQLRGTFAYVTQSGGAFFSGMSVLDVLRFARPDATIEEVTAAAKIACIHEDIEHMPFRYAAILGERGVNISRGQQQRIALAQAILSLGSSRKILVLDEFTSALDAETERRVLANLRPLLRERTAIIVAHRLSTIREIADKIVVLDKGDIIEEGTHTELLARGGWYADMVKLQRV